MPMIQEAMPPPLAILETGCHCNLPPAGAPSPDCAPCSASPQACPGGARASAPEGRACLLRPHRACPREGRAPVASTLRIVTVLLLLAALITGRTGRSCLVLPAEYD